MSLIENTSHALVTTELFLRVMGSLVGQIYSYMPAGFIITVL